MNTISRRFPPVQCFVLVSVLLGCSAATSGQGVAYNFEDFGLNISVEFPAELAVCTARSGGQPQGYFVRFEEGPVDCESTSVDPIIGGIGFLVSSNAAFWQSPEEVADGLCRNSAAASVGAVDLNELTIPGRSTVACAMRRQDGSTDLFVVTQAGLWPQSPNSPEPPIPMVNFTAWLHTTDQNVDHDLPTFRSMLSSIDIE